MANVRSLVRICSLVAIVSAVLLCFYPVHSKVVNLTLLGLLLAAWAGAIVLNWRRRWALVMLLVLAALLALPFLLPGRAIDKGELRDGFVNRMAEFEGTRYLWGGEGTRGIDCSGLPRKALRDTLFWYGVKHGNGRAFRMWAEQWWFDATAKSIQSGYRDYAISLPNTGTIQTMSLEGLLPGDLAITKNGVHMLAYVGDGRWIQADPGVQKVVTLHGRNESNPWFDNEVTTHRWSVLE